jgi:hypothetical protein
VSWSHAHLHHVIINAAIVPSDAKTLAIAEMVEGVICDWRQEWVNICYDEKDKWTNGVSSFMDDTCTPTLACITKELGDKKWILGDHVCTHLHCLLYCLIALMSIIDNLCRFHVI